ncbi:Wiskott-Aldrich syndrome protein family member 3 [Paragonimus skrjabini miyazakii]|uniref:Wiskott-Aldrich syndrome protein family member n=1 Tax=Paragonimus skrjabini miyazakii TaxID=59628 RepID=A0A8S9Z6N4_9TREM|nr:Wiskott-Aldrich syndrome protein family member 3 [Paragonimus skrjabini miyazakii]
MPLPKHTVQPVRVSQVAIPDHVENELEFVANATLCNLMRQMASISQLATNMFEELTAELSSLAERTMRLQNRLTSLHEDVQAMQKGDEDLTANVPLVQLAPFTSKKPADSRVLSRNTIPPSMRACYDRAEPAPPLQQMDQLRDDRRISMKLYSDPDFFFDLWSRKMLQDPKHKGAAKKKRTKPKTRVNASKHTQNKPQMVIEQTGVGGHYVPGLQSSMVPVAETTSPSHKAESNYTGNGPLTGNHLIKPPPVPISNSQQVLDRQEQLPPPPPPPPSQPVMMQPGFDEKSFNQLDGAKRPDSHLVCSSSTHQVNGYTNECGHSQSIPTTPVLMQHPPPPPVPAGVPMNEGKLNGVAAANMSYNMPDGNSLDDVTFPLPSPTVVRDPHVPVQQRAIAGSPGTVSLTSHELPPPPAPIFEPSPDMVDMNHVPVPAQFNNSHDINTASSNLLPLPPPPLPPSIPLLPPLSQLQPASPSSDMNTLTSQMCKLTAADPASVQRSAPIPQGPPADLLSAIRAGITLRKVGERETPATNKFTRNNSVISLGNKPRDVQAIYEAVRRRRECMENNSTDEEDDKDGNSDSSGWGD